MPWDYLLEDIEPSIAVNLGIGNELHQLSPSKAGLLIASILIQSK